MKTPYASYAAVIKAIIMADNTITECEREKFDRYFKEYYDIGPQERKELWVSTFDNTTPVEEHIAVIKDDLRNQPMAMVQFFKFLNSCIYEDGITDQKYETFEHIEELLLG